MLYTFSEPRNNYVGLRKSLAHATGNEDIYRYCAHVQCARGQWGSKRTKCRRAGLEEIRETAMREQVPAEQVFDGDFREDLRGNSAK